VVKRSTGRVLGGHLLVGEDDALVWVDTSSLDGCRDIIKVMIASVGTTFMEGRLAISLLTSLSQYILRT
jgi:hypothetical protein